MTQSPNGFKLKPFCPYGKVTSVIDSVSIDTVFSLFSITGDWNLFMLSVQNYEVATKSILTKQLMKHEV